MELPIDFTNRMKEMLGDEYEDFIASYDREHYKGLRFNSLKCDDYGAIVSDWKLREVPWCRTGYYYDDEILPGRSPLHYAGVYYIQEPSAMVVGEAANVAENERVLDLCAAPGGKTSHLAGAMHGKGLLWANEIVPSRAQILSANVERMGISNAIVSCASPDELAGKLGCFFSTIVVDTPCSGEGMFRRDEIARLEWSEANVQMCAERGKDILAAADKMLLPGGKLVYSTCTFAVDEDEMAIVRFMEEHPEYYIEKIGLERSKDADASDGWVTSGRADWCEHTTEGIEYTYRLWPHKLNGEGHYVAVLRKGQPVSYTNEPEYTGTVKKNEKKDNALATAVKLWKEFAKSTFRMEPEAVIPSIDRREYMMFGENLYLLPVGCPRIDGIKTPRAGLQLGTIKKDRFEPSHALALCLKNTQVKSDCNVSADSEDALKYLKGESISCDSLLKGWTLMTVDGYSIGWGKATGGILKNHYPKGLRIKC